MEQDDRGSLYDFTAMSMEALIRKVAKTTHELCGCPANGFTIFERGPGGYCQGRITSAGYRLLEWRQTPGCIEPDAFARCLEEPNGAQCLTRWKELDVVSKRVTVHVALECMPPERIPNLPGDGLTARRTLEQRRINPKKPYVPPYSDQEWHPKIKERFEKREALWWRTICIDPSQQTADDVFCLLAVILLQEGLVPKAEVTRLKNIVMGYILKLLPRDVDEGTAYLCLHRILSHFTEPAHWDGLRRYLRGYYYRNKSTLCEEKNTETPQVFTTRSQKATRGDGLIAVSDATDSLTKERLRAKRSTLFRWAQNWAMQTPRLAVYDAHGRLWLTEEGMVQARMRLTCRDLTLVQKNCLRKEPDAARKFTARHEPDIWQALQRGETLQDIRQTLLHKGEH